MRFVAQILFSYFAVTMSENKVYFTVCGMDICIEDFNHSDSFLFCFRPLRLT